MEDFGPEMNKILGFFSHFILRWELCVLNIKIYSKVLKIINCGAIGEGSDRSVEQNSSTRNKPKYM